MQKPIKQHRKAFIGMYRWLSREFTTVECTEKPQVASGLIQRQRIHGETVRKVCENFQYLDMGLFVHILSGRRG